MTFITLAIIILCLGSGSAMIYAGIYHGNRMRKRGVEWTQAQGEITDLGFESSGEHFFEIRVYGFFNKIPYKPPTIRI